MAKKKKRDELKPLKVAGGITLGMATGAYIGGKLPGVMGTTITSAMQPSVGMVGPLVSVGLLSYGMHQMKKFPKIHLRKRKYKRR